MGDLGQVQPGPDPDFIRRVREHVQLRDRLDALTQLLDPIVPARFRYDVPLRIDGSLIGRNTRIVKTDFKPKAYRFMLGDNSEVGIRW